MFKIHVQADAAYRRLIDPRRLRQAALETLRYSRLPSRAELTIVITGDDETHALNRQYRGVDSPTDVLSFGAGGAPEEQFYLGDIVISYPRAKAQATSGGHPVEGELMLLVVHGVLHLLGHDHAVPKEKRKMWAAQAQVLQELRVQVKISGR